MNINRWRGQVQLPPADNADANPPTKTTVGGLDADLYDFSGPAAAAVMATSDPAAAASDAATTAETSAVAATGAATGIVVTPVGGSAELTAVPGT